jgi:hypothetical protein
LAIQKNERISLHEKTKNTNLLSPVPVLEAGIKKYEGITGFASRLCKLRKTKEA